MLLEVKNLDAGYGYLQILRNVSLNINKGEYVCIVGPNGAGKSTTMKTIAGLIPPMGGSITFNGEDITGLATSQITKKGISFVSEEMNLFVNMSVRENLLMGAYIIKEKKVQNERLDFVFDLFPRLAERKAQLAGTMSGGERKMLAIGRGMMSDPKLLLVDEPSFGLAPQLTANVFESLDVLIKTGVTIMLVEQNVTKTLSVTDRGYILENGKIGLEGESTHLADDPYVKKVFLGV
jgi:ABC-type branched-subunit amino acid transport system ATPase component